MKFARADHHDILEKRAFFLGYHGDLRVQIFLDQARRGTRIFSAAPRFIPADRGQRKHHLRVRTAARDRGSRRAKPAPARVRTEPVTMATGHRRRGQLRSARQRRSRSEPTLRQARARRRESWERWCFFFSTAD